MGFTVGGTKKGGMPVTVEKRPRGKTVTVIGNVKGDKDELIKLLKHSLGCGGHAVGPMVVEIQGDHHDAIQALLLKHGGTDTMKGVAGLKKRKEEEDTTKTSQQDDEYIDSRDLLKTRQKTQTRGAITNRRADDRRRQLMTQATFAKTESTRHFHHFSHLMKQWRYWDQDYGELPEMHRRHLRDLDDGKSLGSNSVGASFLDADLDDNDRLQSGPRSAVLELMHRNLGAIGQVTQGEAASHEKAMTTLTALRALGMIAEPSPFRQTREERLAESRRNTALAKAKAIAERNREDISVAPVVPSPKWDPALAALREFGGIEPWSGKRRPEEARVDKPSSVGTTSAWGTNATTRTSAWATTATTRKGPPGKGSKGKAFAKPGAHGKGDLSRPSIGFTGGRKSGAAVRFDNPPGFSDDDEWSDDNDANEPNTNPPASSSERMRWDVSQAPGFARNNHGGGFSFGPIPGAELVPDWVMDGRNGRRTGGGKHHGYENHDGRKYDNYDDRKYDNGNEPMDAEELELREALRLSLLESNASQGPQRRVGLHVECDDMWGELTEEQALQLAMDISEQEEKRRARDAYDAYAEYARDYLLEEKYERDDGDGGDEGGFPHHDRADFHPGDTQPNDGRPGHTDADLEGDEDAAFQQALLLSKLESRRESAFRQSANEVMPPGLDEDDALAQALRLSALDANGYEPSHNGLDHHNGAGPSSQTVAGGPSRTAPSIRDHTPSSAATQWAAAQLVAFTGETDNETLAEYSMSMSRSEIEEFLSESFGNAESAKAFADALDAMR